MYTRGMLNIYILFYSFSITKTFNLLTPHESTQKVFHQYEVVDEFLIVHSE